MKNKNPYNDLNLTHWRDYNDILTDSLWRFPNRATGHGHTLDYHGNYIPQIATQLFTRYTRQDEIILDLFLGSGATALEAIRLNRRCLGVELKPDLVDYVRAKLPPTTAPTSSAATALAPPSSPSSPKPSTKWPLPPLLIHPSSFILHPSLPLPSPPSS